MCCMNDPATEAHKVRPQHETARLLSSEIYFTPSLLAFAHIFYNAVTMYISHWHSGSIKPVWRMTAFRNLAWSSPASLRPLP